MRHNPFWTDFDPTNPGHRTGQGWRRLGGPIWRAFVCEHARKHGEARVLRADGRCVRYWRDGDKVRQRTYTNVHIGG